MNKVLIDSNILIRLITNDDEKLTQQAYNVVKNNTCIITSPVLAESIFVLLSFYKYSRADIIKLTEFLDIENFEIEDKEVNFSAIRIFYKTNLSFIDTWVYSKAKSLKVELKTFDKKLQQYNLKN